MATATALLAAAPPAHGRTARLECGQHVTTDVKLRSSLNGCSTGLVAAADGIVIDLNGRTIRGTGEGLGIDLGGRDHVTVINGVIRDFVTGVSLFETSNSRIEGLKVLDVGFAGVSIGAGFEAGPQSNVVTGNRIARSAFAGIRLWGAVDNLVARNTVTDSDTGIDVLTSRATALARNTAMRNATAGISLRDSTGSALLANVASANMGIGINLSNAGVEAGFERNVASGNGSTGIASHDSHGHYRGNVTSDNGLHGLAITDRSELHGPEFTVTGHTARRNGGLGITTLPGTHDGGGNRAASNGDARQCVNLACRP